MRKIELDIVALSHSVTQSHNYAVVLGERKGMRRLPIVIEAFVAQAIAVAMERMAPKRPLSHDLMKNILDTFKINLKEVIISNLLDGIFYARLVCEVDGETVEIDSRTSDALALAVRFNCPIYTFEFILDAAGVILEDPDIDKEEVSSSKSAKSTASTNENSLGSMSIDDLKDMLSDVINQEDYERAAAIRDELKKRGENI